MDRVAHLTLKVTRSCNARCYHCRDRRNLYGPAQHRDLSPSIAEAAFEFCASRHLERITFSGGEPTLARGLSELVALAATYTNSITVITNGWRADEGFWRHLVALGVNHVYISIDGVDEEQHDWLRNRPGLFRRCLALLRTLRRIQLDEPKLKTGVVSIVSTFNLLKLAELQQLVVEEGASRWVLHYPECDSDGVFSPSAEKQQKFRATVLPGMTEYFAHSLRVPTIAEEAVRLLDLLYSPKWRNPSETAAGVYHPDPSAARRCGVPGDFLLLKYDGTLLGCNGGEYSVDGEIGSIAEENGRVAIRPTALARLVGRGMDYCKYCPVPFTIRVPLAP